MEQEVTQGIYSIRGYDVIKDCFFVVKEMPVLNKAGDPVLDHEGNKKCCKETLTFQTFDDYFTCLQGEVYVAACYYGWKPTAEIISKYHINAKRLNYISLESSTLNDYKWPEGQPSDADSSAFQIKHNTNLPSTSNGAYIYKIKKRYNLFDDVYEIRQIWTDSQEHTLHSTYHRFTFFFDYLYFLDGKLAGSDFSALPSRHYTRLESLGLDLSEVNPPIPFHVNPDIKCFKGIQSNENVSRSELKVYEPVENSINVNSDGTLLYGPSEGNKILYVSDLHIDYMLANAKCSTVSDVNELLINLCRCLDKSYQMLAPKDQREKCQVFICGDTATSLSTFQMFVQIAVRFRFHRRLAFILGNHELWGHKNANVTDIVEEYRKVAEKYGMQVYHNEIVFFTDKIYDEANTGYCGYNENYISYNEVMKMSNSELSIELALARVIILAGIGFSGRNNEFNAKNEIYQDAITRRKEIEESNKFSALYKKLITATREMPDRVIAVISHMPLKDWCDNSEHINNVIYVSGHTHKNYYYDDGSLRIYEDNQNGYFGVNPIFKCIYAKDIYDPFYTYENGVYEIKKEDYIKFYRAKKLPMELRCEYNAIYMLKKNGYYCFFVKSKSGRLSILNGGKPKMLGKRNILYYFENMDMMIQQLMIPLIKYTALQVRISNAIKMIGGSGNIHGCIIDIDWWNHIYVNPVDLTVASYWARDIIDKIVYPSLPALLKEKLPVLYAKYQKLLLSEPQEILPFQPTKAVVTKRKKSSELYFETEIYDVSRKIKKMQKLYSNILTTWYDKLLLPATAKGLKSFNARFLKGV